MHIGHPAKGFGKRRQSVLVAPSLESGVPNVLENLDAELYRVSVDGVARRDAVDLVKQRSSILPKSKVLNQGLLNRSGFSAGKVLQSRNALYGKPSGVGRLSLSKIRR